VRVEFFEHVGFQFRVAADSVEDLPTLGFVSVFEKIGDVGGFEPAEPACLTSRGTGAGVADQWFECLPIPGRMPTPTFD
ncbi:hypothetical protein BST31_24755, partial [Mycobacterium marseillense]